MAVAQHPRVAGERPVRAGGGGHVAGADWWTGPAGWRVGVAPVSRAAVRLSLLLKELAKVLWWLAEAGGVLRAIALRVTLLKS